MFPDGDATADSVIDTLYHLTPDLLCSRSIDGYLVRVNANWLSTLGWLWKEVQSQQWIELVHPDDRDSTLEIDYRCQQSDAPSLLTHENRWRHRDGHYRWLSWRLTPYRQGISHGLAQDITNRSWSGGLAYRQGIQETILLRDQAIAASSVGIVIADARLPDMPLIYVNPAFERMTGYAASEVLGSNCRFLQGQDTDQPAIDTLRQAIRQGTHCTTVLRNYRKDGSLFWNELNISPIYDSAQQITHFVGVQSDITARKQAEAALEIERAKTEQLLLNILPAPIAEQLKQYQIGTFQSDQAFIAEAFSEATVLFADLVGFTRLANQLPPKELITLLNRIFSSFDHLCDRNGLEKIKTIGDAYMVVGGLPRPCPNHAEVVAAMALDMRQALTPLTPRDQAPLQLRIGLHSGPVIAGVIGTKKFAYDLWGDTVNVASRMESLGQPGKIQVTQATYERLRHRYQFRQRGITAIKGKGWMRTYWLTGRH